MIPIETILDAAQFVNHFVAFESESKYYASEHAMFVKDKETSNKTYYAYLESMDRSKQYGLEFHELKRVLGKDKKDNFVYLENNRLQTDSIHMRKASKEELEALSRSIESDQACLQFIYKKGEVLKLIEDVLQRKPIRLPILD